MKFSCVNNLLRPICKFNHLSSRFLYRVRTSADLDDEVRYMIQRGLRPHRQPGKRSIPQCELPLILQEAAIRVVKKYKRPGIWDDICELFNQLHHRQLPVEMEDVRLKTSELRFRYKEMDRKIQEELKHYGEEELALREQQRIERGLKRELYNWTPIDYDDYKSVVYMAGRLPPNFAALKAIFNGISKDDPSFKPESLFDFGSGIGTVLWAAREIWPKSINEYFSVDISSKATKIADLLLRKGQPNKRPIFENVITRQFLPVSSDTKFDIVVSAFSLLDLPSKSSRINTIENLWHKTKDILVIVETGKKAGFQAVLEARNLIMDITGHKVSTTFKVSRTDQQLVPREEKNIPKAHIMAPCPHHQPCPRLFKGEPDPCHFKASYQVLKIGELSKKLMGNWMNYSYVVLRKQPIELKKTPPWPRLIIPAPMKKSRCVYCNLCCPDGTLKKVVIQRSFHEPALYAIAERAKLHDLLPVKIYDYFKNVPMQDSLTSGHVLLEDDKSSKDQTSSSDSDSESSGYSSDDDNTTSSSDDDDKNEANGETGESREGSRNQRK